MTDTPIDQRRVLEAAELYDFVCEYRQNTESTNNDVLACYARQGNECIAVSESQSAGRGRRGTQWFSPYAQNIYCTIGLRKSLSARSQGLLSIVTGIALCRALQHSVAANVNLKWPNDLICDSKKLGGVLIESQPQDHGSIFFAIGFGLNVFMSDDELASIGRPITSLARVTNVAVDRTAVLIACIDAVVESVRSFELAQVSDLVAEFREYDAFPDTRVDVISGPQRISGINRGIDINGQLQLETEHGIQVFSAAEISLRPILE